MLIRPELPGGQQRQLRDFEEGHRPEIEQFQRDLSQRFPRARRLEFTRLGPAEAIRWSLARISEQPAYAQLRGRTRESERLKSEF